MKLYHLLFLTILVGCEKFELISLENKMLDSLSNASYSLEYVIDSLDFVMSNDVLERAYQMVSLEWTPLKRVPANGGGYYAAGRSVRGIPYSSVKEINTYLFQDVSYHTFMTAVHNPKSVLYTENISKDPYNGENCAPYYGAVCSSAVMYALDIDIPYYVSQIKKHPLIQKLENQVIDSLRVCDLICKSGHVQMIFDVEYRADTLFQIMTFESSGRNAHITKYSKEKFLTMWNNGRYVGYRYNKLKYSEDKPVFKGVDIVNYNNDLCPSKGDRSVYRTTDTVTINIFNTEYNRIILMCDSTEVASADYIGDDHKFFDLQPGIYFVYLQKEEDKSPEVSFEIIETDVSYSACDDVAQITVFFHSSAEPKYVAICDLPGNSICYPISPMDRERGYITVPRMDKSEYYCKVVFKGEYGRIINEPIRVY